MFASWLTHQLPLAGPVNTALRTQYDTSKFLTSNSGNFSGCFDSNKVHGFVHCPCYIHRDSGRWFVYAGDWMTFMCITEKWHQLEVYSVLNKACPPSYSYLKKARCTGLGGGLAVIHRNDLKVSTLALPELSFECVALKCNPPTLWQYLSFTDLPNLTQPSSQRWMNFSPHSVPHQQTLSFLVTQIFMLTPPPATLQPSFYIYLTVSTLNMFLSQDTPGETHTWCSHCWLCPHQQSADIWSGCFRSQGGINGSEIPTSLLQA